MKTAWAFAVLGAVALLEACSGGGAGTPAGTVRVSVSGAPSSGAPSSAPSVNPQTLIKHVVFVIQENRSFDNLFHGFAGADFATTGLTHSNQVVQLKPVGLEAPYDPNHGLVDFLTAWDKGQMNGFDFVGYSGGPAPSPYPLYAYVPSNETAPYVALAKQFTLADRMFTSQIDGSFTAHQFMIAGQSDDTVDFPNNQPWGCDGPSYSRVPTLTAQRTLGPSLFPCFDYQTLGDELDAKNLSWRYYAPPLTGDPGGELWTAYDAVKHIRYGPDWANEVTPASQILKDAAAGTLANVTWVVPDYADSDHGGNQSAGGPAWVQSVVNAIGASPEWSSSAIFVVWDDWGGWYDHVPPPQLDTQGLGIRVPLIVVSPYAKSGYVSHVQYETAGLLTFAEAIFGLPALAAADARANALFDCFDFNQTPRSYASIRKHLSGVRYVPHGPSGVAPDLQ